MHGLHRLRGIAALGVVVLGSCMAALAQSSPPPPLEPLLPPHLRVMSISLCTDQLLLALLPPERITSVTWLAHEPSGSLLRQEALQVATNRGLAEEVVRDRPDLVLAGSFTTPATRGLLRQLKFPLLEIGSLDSFDDIRRATREIAAAVGASPRAEELLARMDATLETLAQTAPAPLRVAAWDGSGFSARPGSLYDTLLRTAGAINLAHEAKAASPSAPTVETLMAMAPALLVRGSPKFDKPGRRSDAAHHPLVGRYWGERTIVLLQSAYVCGTPFAADAAVALRSDIARLQTQASTPLPFARATAP